MTFTAYKGEKKLGIIQAESFEEAEKIGNEKYPKWTEIFLGKEKDWQNKGKGYGE